MARRALAERYRERGLETLLNFDHLEVFLAGTAVRADPGFGHVFPARPGRNAVVRGTFLFVVNPAADDAHPAFEFLILAHGYHSSINAIRRSAPLYRNAATARSQVVGAPIHV